MKISPVLAILSLLCAGAGAATLTVAPDGSGEYATIQDAIGAADWSGDVIELLPGTFTGFGNVDVVSLGKSFTIRSQDGDPTSVTIDCQGSAGEPHRFLHIQGNYGLMRLEGLTVTGGYAGATRIPAGGGLLITNGSDAVVERCVFEDNHAAMSWDNGGGGVYIDNGSDPSFTDCVFRGNSGFFGGAVGVNHFSHATFTRCSFLDNTGGRGGAVWGNSTTKIACLIVGNTAQQGGAIWGNGSLPEVSISCTYVGNGAPLGGAIYAEANYGSPVQLENTIVAFGSEGVGIFVGDGVPFQITCTDLYGNPGGDWVGNLAGHENLDGNFGADPCFCDLTTLDLHLCADSFCLPGQHPWGCDGLVGALGPGCDACGCSDVVAVRGRSWSSVKGLFR